MVRKPDSPANHITLKHLLIITVIYSLAQWLLLVLSGYWWDDGPLLLQTAEERRQFYQANGSVFGLYYTNSVIWMPAGGYRICVFFEFLFCTWFVYFILRKVALFSERDCCWITAAFAVAPVNDARAMLICYGYSGAFFFFWLAFFLVTLWWEESGMKRWIMRALSLLLLFLSYSCESLLLMTVLILAFLYEVDYRSTKGGHNTFIMYLRAFPKAMLRYIDYLLIPCLFWIIRTATIHPSGLYATRNQITGSSLASAILKFPTAFVGTLFSLLANCGKLLKYRPRLWLVLFAGFGIWLFYSAKKEHRITGDNICSDHYATATEDLKRLIIGFLCFCIGLFPYSLVRGGNEVDTTGFSGRDSICLGLGIAISLVYLIKIVFRKNLVPFILSAFIVLGILHFNTWYIQYQREWYEELELMQEISINGEIQNNNTFWFINRYGKPCGTSRFYNLNANAATVTGEMTRWFVSDLEDLNDGPNDYLTGFGMKNYDPSDTCLDGIIIFDNEPLSSAEVLRLKWKEIFSPDQFEQEIRNFDRIRYVSLTEEKSAQLLTAFNSGVTDDALLLAEIGAY